MGQRERFILFMVGVLLGVGMLFGFNSRSQPERDRRRQVRDSLSLPGMMYDYAATSRGFYGHYVKHESVQTRPDGSKVRTLVTGGRRRYDDKGRELPEEDLLVKETYAAGVGLAEAGPVASHEFAYADRIALKLRPGRKASEVVLQSGDTATEWAGHEEAILRLDAWRRLPGGAPWATLENLVRELNGHPAVSSARLVPIDWPAEAELIRANSPK